MTTSFHQRLRKNIKRLLVVFLVIVLLIILRNVFGYINVLRMPFHAFFVGQPIIQIEGLQIDGKSLTLDSDKWKIHLEKPKKNLRGVKEFFIVNVIDDKTGSYLSIRFCPLVNEEIIKTTSNFQEMFAVTVTLGTDFDNMFSTSIPIREVCNNPSPDLLASVKTSGQLHLEEYSQSIKKLVFVGSIQNLSANIKCWSNNDVNCKDFFGKEKENLLVTIDKFSFHLDSPIIYEWSNKAGKTWRL